MPVIDGENFELSDFRGLGHSEILPAIPGEGIPAEPRFPDRMFRRINNAVGDIDGDSTAAAASAAAALVSENNAATHEDGAEAAAVLAVTAKDIAVAAATSVQFPFATTAGTASAYTASTGGSPTLPIGDGFAIRLNFHTANNASPTLNIDGTGALELVDGLNLAAGGSYRSLDANDIFLGMNLVVMKDTSFTPNKYVITGGFPIYELSRDLNANGYNIKNLRTYTNGVKYQGALKNGVAVGRFLFTTNTRLFKIKRKVVSGSIDVSLSKNGSQLISFTDSPNDTVHCSTSLTEATISEGGNPYVDFVAGDYIEFTFTNNSSATYFFCQFDMQENYA